MDNSPQSSAFYKATNQYVDWHDFIEITDQFSPKQRSQLEQSLNELINIPAFQEILIRSQSPEIMQEWRKLVKLTPPSDDIIQQYQFEKYCRPDNKKIHITNAEGTTFNLTDQDGKETGRVMSGGSSFFPLLRIVAINFRQKEQIKFWADDGSLYRPSLQHTLFHEIDHSSGLAEYRLGVARAIVEKEIKQRQISEGLPKKDAAKAQRTLYKRLYNFTEEIIETRVISDTNAAMQFYDEPVRIGHSGGFTALPNENYMGKFNETALLANSENTLNLTNVEAFSVEDLRKKFSIKEKPAPNLIMDAHEVENQPQILESARKAKQRPIFDAHRIDRHAMDFVKKTSIKIKESYQFEFDPEMKISPPTLPSSLPSSFTRKR